MKIYKIKTKSKSLIYDMYGIFVDYLIGTNQYMLLDCPKYNYENFKNLIYGMLQK